MKNIRNYLDHMYIMYSFKENKYHAIINWLFELNNKKIFHIRLFYFIVYLSLLFFLGGIF